MRVKELRLNLKPLIKKLEVGLKRGYSEETLTSSFKSVFKGRGLEFEGFRVYTPADDARGIDWKASLRAQELLIRVLTEERNIHVFFILDVSDSMIFASTDKLKCEYAAELIATISYGVIEASDSVGLCMFTDKVVQLIPGNIGMNQFYKVTKSLSNPKLYGGKFDLNFVLRYVTSFLKRNTVVFIVSDFIGLKPGWKQHLEIMSKKFEVVGVMIRDPRDNKLPKDAGQFVLGDPYSDADILVDVRLIKDKYEQYTKQQIEEVKNTFTDLGADILLLQTDESFVYPILELFNRRKQRWR